MNRTRLFGAAALVVALVVGAISFNGTGPVQAAGPTGPTIIATGPYLVPVGSPINIAISDAANPVGPVSPYTGYNIGLVYLDAALSLNAPGSVTAAAPCWVDNSAAIFAPSSVSPSPTTCNSNFGGLLSGGRLGVVAGAVTLSPAAASTAFGAIGTAKFNATNVGVTGFHMVTQTDIPNAVVFGTYGMFTLDTALISFQDNAYACGSVPTSGPPFGTGACGPILSGPPPSPVVPGSTAADDVVVIQAPAPVLSMSKTASAPSVVAGGQSFSYTLTVSNAATPAVTATGVSVSDTLPASIPIANVTLPAGCTNVGQVVTCTPSGGTLAPGASATWVLNVSATDPNAGNTIAHNCATATDNMGLTSPNSTPATSCADVSIIPPAVAWSKSPASTNDFLTTGTGAFTFDEIMTNQGDPNGLGGFAFDLHYDPTIFSNPTVDTSPAAALFTAAGRTLSCSMSILGNGIDHIACASTGPFGVGPSWIGPKVMAHVTMTPLEIVTEQVRPNKENGIVTAVKDTNTVVSNTCGQPLNDGTIQPLPGQPECQGNPLQGVGPGGTLNDSMTVATIRRLEGDVTKDCSVDIADMQLEASKYGTSVGSLLYNVFYDVNSPLQHGDGEIDILDVQFVYGRMGSTCTTPIPAQPAASLP
ncbi:MAG: DUF11 domain-containing protein [Chloroflexota bacterium]|nr:DUF11 domain-containing protein [Chloroflexota bacterium]